MAQFAIVMLDMTVLGSQFTLVRVGYSSQLGGLAAPLLHGGVHVGGFVPRLLQGGYLLQLGGFVAPLEQGGYWVQAGGFVAVFEQLV